MSKHYSSVLTLGPLGYMPAGGTRASMCTVAVYCLMYYFFQVTLLHYVVIMFVGTLIAGYMLHKNVPAQVHDPREIVIDEVVGMGWALLATPFTLKALTLRVILFRFFDITKCIISPLEQLPGMWGIMADDIAAALITQVLVWMFMC